MKLSILLTALFSLLVCALQTPAQLAALIPSCVLPCDVEAIQAVGCPQEDYACHCAHGKELEAIVTPCLQKNANCSASNLQAFASIVVQICQNLNVTANATGTGGIPAPTSTYVPVSVGMQHGAGAGTLAVLVGLAVWML